MAKVKSNKKYEWDFSEIFATQKDFDKAINKYRLIIKKIASFKGKIAKANSETYFSFHNLLTKGEDLFSRLVMYSYKYEAQMNDTLALENKTKVISLEHEMALSGTWISNEVRKLGEKKILSFIRGNKKYSYLEHSVKNYFRIDKFHLKPEQEEFVANFKTLFESPSNIYTQLAFADKKLPDIEYKNKTQKLTSSLLAEIVTRSHISKDQDLRQKAAHLYSKSFALQENTYNSLYETLIKTDMTIAKLKGYKSALEAGLNAENVPEQVYLNFIKNAYSNSNIMYDYFMIHRKQLKIRGARKYYKTDSRMPLFELSDKDFKFTPDEAVKICKDALKPLGEEYNTFLLEALKPGRIDYYEKEGKTDGGFSASTPYTEAYILMNWSNDYSSLVTLIHELGHSTHSYLAKKHQKPEYANYSILVAEVASTFCELMLSKNMLEKHKEKNIRTFLLQQVIQRFSVLYFMTAKEANFEYKAKQSAFEGIPTNKNFLQDLAKKVEFEKTVFDKTKKEYFANNVELNWPSLLHHYTTTFYLYKYALSFVVSCSLFFDYLESGTVTGFINLLKAGGTDHPIDLIKKHANVDLNDIKSHDKLFKLAKHYIDEFRKEFE